MSFTGLAKPYVAKLENEKLKKYSKCFIAGGAIAMDITPEYNEAKLYADNKLSEYNKKFKQATVKMNTTRIPLVGGNVMFGHEITDTEVIYKSSDNPNDVGVGYYVEETIDGESKYVAMIIWKVKFSESAEGYATQGENIEYKTPSIDGVAYPIEGNDWKKTKVFDTEQEADEWIQTIFGYKEKCIEPSANVTSGTYEGSQSVTLTANEGETIYYTTNGITPTPETGTEYTSAIAVTASLALKAIAVKEGKITSDIATYEYIIN